MTNTAVRKKGVQKSNMVDFLMKKRQKKKKKDCVPSGQMVVKNSVIMSILACRTDKSVFPLCFAIIDR
jgi:hypothetical protein